jgi:hypothetical protein
MRLGYNGQVAELTFHNSSIDVEVEYKTEKKFADS